ncbi:hypothetical protein BGZ98_010207 [Dissophora globulifera]|nr:hypothetical protein BGZ98_010207 [Dissophora globulifera]
MSHIGYPQTGLSAQDFYSKARHEADPNKRRRLFADARQSNLCTFQIYVLDAEVEERWGADSTRLGVILSKGIVVYKNPAGQGAHCAKVSSATWLQEAAAADRRGSVKTAAALRKAVAEHQ